MEKENKENIIVNIILICRIIVILFEQKSF